MSRSVWPVINPPRLVDGPPSDHTFTPSATYEVGKRLMDVVGSFILIVGLAPVYVLIAAVIKLESVGPAIFRQQRLGRGGRPFLCYKFRTMVRDAEARLAASEELSSEFDANYKLKGDPRVTKVGAFLRRTSLDELPQFWNVIRGEMSLIGPRPIIEPELVKYGVHAERLLSVKPGLGGYWQINGRSDTTYPERVAMDIQYVNSRSLFVDLTLLLLTAAVVVRGRGAY